VAQPPSAVALHKARNRQGASGTGLDSLITDKFVCQ